MGNIDISLKERQIEIAQQWVNIIANARPKYKDKKVVAVDNTEHPFEAVVRFNDWTTTVVTGLDAKHILAGKLPKVG